MCKPICFAGIQVRVRYPILCSPYHKKKIITQGNNYLGTVESLLWLAKHPRWPHQQNNNSQRVDGWGWVVLDSWECLSRVLGKSLSAVDMWLIVWNKHPRWPMSRPHSQPIPFKHFHLEHTFWPAHQNHHLRNLTGYHANKLTEITCRIRILGNLFSNENHVWLCYCESVAQVRMYIPSENIWKELDVNEICCICMSSNYPQTAGKRNLMHNC